MPDSVTRNGLECIIYNSDGLVLFYTDSKTTVATYQSLRDYAPSDPAPAEQAAISAHGAEDHSPPGGVAAAAAAPTSPTASVWRSRGAGVARVQASQPSLQKRESERAAQQV